MVTTRATVEMMTAIATMSGASRHTAGIWVTPTAIGWMNTRTIPETMIGAGVGVSVMMARSSWGAVLARTVTPLGAV